MSLQDRMLMYRAKKRLSTKAASELAGISDQTWRYIEKGLQNANPVTIAKIKLLIDREETNESIDHKN